MAKASLLDESWGLKWASQFERETQKLKKSGKNLNIPISKESDRNGSGYKDPTASTAMKNCRKKQ